MHAERDHGQEWKKALATLHNAGWHASITCPACPVQVEGLLPCGEQFFFHARHDEVQLVVGGDDPVDDPDLWHREVAVNEDASWLPAEPGLRLLLALAAEHRCDAG